MINFDSLPVELPQKFSLVTGCTTNVNQLDAYAGARGFNPEFRQYASRLPGHCGSTVVSKMFPPLNLACRDIASTKWNRQCKTNHLKQMWL